ncbi:MAG: NAD-dependent epimerase/dehydratase family protein [Pirellulales bacterium]
MNVLVTGGAGFIGSHLIERLLARDAAARVVCLDDFNDAYEPAFKRANVAAFADHPRATVIAGSLCNGAAVRQLLAEHQISHLLHLGAYAGVRASVEHPEPFVTTNVGGTLALLEAARAHRLARFVFVSSSTVYGDGAAVPFVEDAPLGIPLSPYGVSKRAAELMCLSYWRMHGVPAVCLRPFSVYGPRIRPDLAMWIFAQAILEGRPIPLLGDGSFRRDFTHVSDVCDGLLAALTVDNVVGQAINLGHDQPVAIGALIALLEQSLGRSAVVERRAASPADLPLTHADLSKARRLLRYQPQVALADGVREFAEWFRSRRSG